MASTDIKNRVQRFYFKKDRPVLFAPPLRAIRDILLIQGRLPGPSQRPSDFSHHTINAALIVLPLFILSRIFMYAVLGIQANDFSSHSFITNLCRWDCVWYLGMTGGGYQVMPNAINGQANWAFFPLYPLIAGIIRSAFSLSALTALTVASNAAALATGFVAAKILRNRDALIAFCVLLYFGPLSFYFATGYTESLFVLLTLACFHVLSKRRYVAVGLLAALLSATRAVGVMMTVAILIAALQDHLKEGRSIQSFPRAVLQNPQIFFALATAPLGLFVYMGYLYLHLGDALAFSHVQWAWFRQPGFPLKILLEALSTGDLGLFLRDGAFSARWSALWATLALILTGYLVILRRFPEAVFSFLAIIIPLSTHIMSMPRYAIGLAPLLIIASQLIASHKLSMRISLPALILSNIPLLVLWQSKAVGLA
ncbi:hypothetical protein MHY87_14560 [Microvirga sp. ACRRW]|uniref:mannosyltransferase family protein n=1 Tax=Microvirga sp. ACRRW TaxID=2918205 RepID=UPI001EF73C3D|nr:mannosyltransferase family protein [Microvirga sp. ACRRW]MCG7394128.1 hypothetical protein [Microvirga sp. ACRRW]